MTKPSIPQGTRDFGPEVVRKRSYIFDTIRNVFELYGFQPLETPAMENIETLMGKYGEVGDKLIYKIRSNKNIFKTYPEKADEIKKILKKVSDFDYSFLPHKSNKALRYDLTIPFARYVAMNHGKLTFPFKRYQIQPVWRGDRPQKGRYREFYQCDADIVGSYSLLNEVELLNIYATVFEKLGIKVEIKINSRKVLRGIMEVANIKEKEKQILVIIDKLDKIGIDGVREELDELKIPEKNLDTLLYIYAPLIENEEILTFLRKILSPSEIGMEGIKELEFITSWNDYHNPKTIIDLTLARGLEYYTGTIFEAKAKDVNIGSIGGGGRYDDLTGLFAVPNIPGTGISFGVDRIYDVMEELNLFPKDLQISTKILFFNLGEKESKKAFELMQQLRSNNISCELYHEAVKFDKQFKYAEKKNIPYVIIIGEKELKENTCNIKNLATGEQMTIAVSDLPSYKFS